MAVDKNKGNKESKPTFCEQLKIQKVGLDKLLDALEKNKTPSSKNPNK